MIDEGGYRRTRRAILTGREDGRPASAPALHISSAVLTVLPSRLDAVLAELSGMPDVEIHHAAATKIIVVLEGADGDAVGGRLAGMSLIDGVLAASMVYEQRVDLEADGA